MRFNFSLRLRKTATENKNYILYLNHTRRRGPMIVHVTTSCLFLIAMSVNLSTVQKWIKDVDSLGEWLRYDESGGKVKRIFCALCTKHKERLRGARNFSGSFVDIICETALKNDNVKKHQKSDQHARAVDIERKPTVTEIYRYTPIGRALARSSQEQTTRVCKLFEVTYMLAKEEIPFAKYPAVLELEKRHGASFGTAYATERKCRHFTILIGESMRDNVFASVRKSRYLAVLMDDSTDSSVVEKEMLYVMFVGPDGKVECRFFQLKDASDATAPGLKSLLLLD